MKFNRENLDPLLIGGVSISIIVALVLVLLNEEKLISATIALLGIVITLQIEQIARLDKGLKKNARYSDLWHKIELSPMLQLLIPEIIESATRVLVNGTNELFSDHARLKLEGTKNYFNNSAQGYLITPYDDIEPLILATEKTKARIRAVSMFKVDERFWHSASGRRYWNINKAAIERGVIIERIFICDTITDGLKALATEQMRAGIKVFTITGGQLQNDLRQDMIIYDKDFTYKAIVNADGLPIENALSTNLADINERIRDFDRIKFTAEEFS